MTPVPKRGDIYKLLVLEKETVSNEFHGHHWYVVFSIPDTCTLFGIVLAIPLTSPEYKSDSAPKDTAPYRQFRIRIPASQKMLEAGENGLNGDSLALVHQIRPLAIERFTNVPISGRLTQEAINVLEVALARVLKMPPPGISPATLTVSQIQKGTSPLAESPKPAPGLPVTRK